MKQEANTVEFKVFDADIKKMTDAELEASLKELRELAEPIEQRKPKAATRRRAA